MTEENTPQQPFWKCEICGHTLQADKPPEVCPSCNNKCAWVDVSCYTPECGKGPDPKLLGDQSKDQV